MLGYRHRSRSVACGVLRRAVLLGRGPSEDLETGLYRVPRKQSLQGHFPLGPLTVMEC
jgi:hypothetical protein